MDDVDISLSVLTQRAKSLLRNLKHESLRNSIDSSEKAKKSSSTKEEEASWDEFSETIGEIVQLVNSKRTTAPKSPQNNLHYESFNEEKQLSNHNTSFMETYEEWKQKLPKQASPQKKMNKEEEDYFTSLNKYFTEQPNKATHNKYSTKKENQLDTYVLNNSNNILTKDENLMPYFMQRRDQIQQEIR